jgi:predicted metalloprotease with PDZ domain
VKSIQDLKEAYTGAAVSSQVKLGIERNAEMSIVSFEKADPGKLPKRRIMINKGGGEGGDIMLVPGTGLLIGSKGKDVVVNDILSDGPSSFKDADVRKGDVLTAVNDAKVGSFKEFSDAYKKVAVGENVTFHTSRKGEHLSFSFKKVEGGQQRIIKREQE